MKKKHKKLKKKEEDNFGRKKKAKQMEKMEKKYVGKVKAEFSTSSILKKNSIKIILEKNMWGNTIANKNHMRKHCNNPQCFKEKITKKNRQRLFGKKKEKNW